MKIKLFTKQLELRLKKYEEEKLQGKSEPVNQREDMTLNYLQGHKDGLKWAAQLAEASRPFTGDWLYDDQNELAKAIRNGPDMSSADLYPPAELDS